MRKIVFATNEYYHIYNRGVDKRDVFLDEKDYWKFFNDLRDFNNRTYYEERLQALGYSKDIPKEPGSLDFRGLRSFLAEQDKIVEIISYGFLTNHFHLIIKQLAEKGISIFMHKVGLSITNYLNKKYERSGHIFQGPFKAVHIDSNDYLVWLVGYVNGNAEIHGLSEAGSYNWSSYRALLEKKSKELGSLGKPKEPGSLGSSFSLLSGADIILSQFKTVEELKSFIQTVIQESKTKKEMKKYLLE